MNVLEVSLKFFIVAIVILAVMQSFQFLSRLHIYWRKLPQLMISALRDPFANISEIIFLEW